MLTQRKYRGKIDIIADVLKAAELGAKKTHIMYRANLSYTLLEKYLGQVLDFGFLTLDGNTYKLTREGERFRSNYVILKKMKGSLAREWKGLSDEKTELEKMCAPIKSQ